VLPRGVPSFDARAGETEVCDVQRFQVRGDFGRRRVGVAESAFGASMERPAEGVRSDIPARDVRITVEPREQRRMRAAERVD
jgi:hypothetical protein